VNNNNAWDLDSMLSQEIQDLNRDTAEDRRVKEAIIISKSDPNQINRDDSSSDSSDEEDEVEATRTRRSPQVHFTSNDDDEYEDDLAIRDPELFKITESNRQIEVDSSLLSTSHTSTKHKLIRRPPELVFSDPPTLVSRDDYIEVTFHYGLSDLHKSTKKSRKYMMMCDFGEESMYAMKWGIGTLLRSGDEVHVASVVTPDEEVEDMDKEEKYRLWAELDKNSKTMISRVKTILDEMLLYDVKVVTYSVAGKTRESLLNLVSLVIGCEDQFFLF
jgi:hypothetical protein